MKKLAILLVLSLFVGLSSMMAQVTAEPAEAEQDPMMTEESVREAIAEDARMMDAGDGVIEPRPINLNEVRQNVGYPLEALTKGIEGTVVLKVLVDKEGNYAEHKVVRSSHESLLKACEAQIENLKFSPATLKEEPIKFWVHIPFMWKYEDPKKKKKGKMDKVRLKKVDASSTPAEGAGNPDK